MWPELADLDTASANQPWDVKEWLFFLPCTRRLISLSLSLILFSFLQMYIALISAHALGLSGMHFFTCIKVQWNGKEAKEYVTCAITECQRDKVCKSENTDIYSRRLNPLREIKRGRVEKVKKVIVSRRKSSCSARVIGIVLHCHHRAAIDLPRSHVGLCRNEPDNEDSISVLELQLLVPSTRWWCDLARKYFPAVCFQCSPGLLGF